MHAWPTFQGTGGACSIHSVATAALRYNLPSCVWVERVGASAKGCVHEGREGRGNVGMTERDGEEEGEGPHTCAIP